MVLLSKPLINHVVNNHNKMASSKNARKITLPSFENVPSLDSGDFSGHSATSSASFANAQLWPKHLRRWILGVYEIYSVPHEESELMLGMHDVTSIATIHFT